MARNMATATTITVNDNLYMTPVTVETKNRRRNQSECIYLERKSSVESVHKRKRNYSECLATLKNKKTKRQLNEQLLTNGFRELAGYLPQRDASQYMQKDSKLDTLETAIEYIKELHEKLEVSQASKGNQVTKTNSSLVNMDFVLDDDDNMALDDYILPDGEETMASYASCESLSESLTIGSEVTLEAIKAPAQTSKSIPAQLPVQSTAQVPVQQTVQVRAIAPARTPGPMGQAAPVQSADTLKTPVQSLKEKFEHYHILSTGVAKNENGLDLKQLQEINKAKRNLHFEVPQSYDEPKSAPKTRKLPQQQQPIREALSDVTNTVQRRTLERKQSKVSVSCEFQVPKTTADENNKPKKTEKRQPKKRANNLQQINPSQQNIIQTPSIETAQNQDHPIDFTAVALQPQQATPVNYVPVNNGFVNYSYIPQGTQLFYPQINGIYPPSDAVMFRPSYDWRQDFMEQWRQSCFQSMRGNN